MRVLVLGATGFIGTRVVDELVLQHGAEVPRDGPRLQESGAAGATAGRMGRSHRDRTAGDA